MKTKGFTLIELMIVIAIIGIGAVLLLNATSMESDGSICRGGYKFLPDNRGGYRQVLNEKGGGIPCGPTEPKKEY